MPAARIREYPPAFYRDMRDFMMDPALPDQTTGRQFFEYCMWPMFFKGKECEQEWYDDADALSEEPRIADRIHVCTTRRRSDWD